MSKLFCIGNGRSRDGFNLESLRPHGKIYGCNALYRDFTPDVLCAVDQGICHEIYHSGYCDNNEAWFRSWTKVPAAHYEMMLYAGLNKNEVDNVKREWDGLYENERGDATEFVYHGTNMQGIVNIMRRDKTTYKEKIDKSFAYVSWIKPNDKSNNILDICEEKDLGWACGAMSGYIGIKQQSPKEVYLIGHDLVSDTNTVNNLYAGTRHYVSTENAPTPHVNWVKQWHTLFDWNPNIQFYKVNPTDGRVSEQIPEWQKFVGKNLSYIDYPRLDKRLGL
jgi:hypothetical protein